MTASVISCCWKTSPPNIFFQRNRMFSHRVFLAFDGFINIVFVSMLFSLKIGEVCWPLYEVMKLILILQEAYYSLGGIYRKYTSIWSFQLGTKHSLIFLLKIADTSFKSKVRKSPQCYLFYADLREHLTLLDLSSKGQDIAPKDKSNIFFLLSKDQRSMFGSGVWKFISDIQKWWKLVRLVGLTRQ